MTPSALPPAAESAARKISAAESVEWPIFCSRPSSSRTEIAPEPSGSYSAKMPRSALSSSFEYAECAAIARSLCTGSALCFGPMGFRPDSMLEQFEIRFLLRDARAGPFRAPLREIFLCLDPI